MENYRTPILTLTTKTIMMLIFSRGNVTIVCNIIFVNVCVMFSSSVDCVNG